MKNLVFIHGSGNDGRVWNDVRSYLSNKYTIFTPTLPGHLDEDGKCETIECYSEWILKYILDNKLQDVVLIGHSMGGAIAIKSAVSDFVSAVIIVGSGLKLPVNKKILDGLKNDTETTIEMIAKWSFTKMVDENLKKSAIEMMLENKNAILNDFAACNNYKGYNEAKKINIPALVILGDSDVMTPINLAEEIKEYLKTDIVQIENSGHMVQLENPKALARTIDRFVDFI